MNMAEQHTTLANSSVCGLSTPCFVMQLGTKGGKDKSPPFP